MESKMNWIDVTALVLVVIGALNWGLVSLFNYDVVAQLFGNYTAVSRVIYGIVGLAGLWTIYTAVKAGQQSTSTTRPAARM